MRLKQNSLAVLEYLHHNPNSTMPEISRGVVAAHSQVRNTVYNLKKHGYITSHKPFNQSNHGVTYSVNAGETLSNRVLTTARQIGGHFAILTAQLMVEGKRQGITEART